mmetsp:Transcript_48454/g.105054  ORF Transcript_48454/g.105054 Transcript_48454/m.105054 type:complete len:81 (+) Transcript_48454:577-819(+)
MTLLRGSKKSMHMYRIVENFGLIRVLTNRLLVHEQRERLSPEKSHVVKNRWAMLAAMYLDKQARHAAVYFHCAKLMMLLP